MRVQFPAIQFCMSGFCQTRDHDTNLVVASVNVAFRRLCEENGWDFLSNDYISQSDLVDQVHLTTWGSLTLH